MTLYLFFTGQSNMEGCGIGGDFSTVSPLVKFWNNKMGLNDLTQLGNAWVTPDIDANPFHYGHNCLAVWAADAIARETGEEVRAVIVAKGAQGIGEWYDGATGPMFDRSVAVLNAAGVTVLNGLFWQQGEHDNTMLPSTYSNRFAGVTRNYRNLGFINFTTPVVLGEATASFAGTNANLAACVTLDKRTALVPSKRLPVRTQDGVHFVSESLTRLGKGHAAAWSLLRG